MPTTTNTEEASTTDQHKEYTALRRWNEALPHYHAVLNKSLKQYIYIRTSDTLAATANEEGALTSCSLIMAENRGVGAQLANSDVPTRSKQVTLNSIQHPRCFHLAKLVDLEGVDNVPTHLKHTAIPCKRSHTNVKDVPEYVYHIYEVVRELMYTTHVHLCKEDIRGIPRKGAGYIARAGLVHLPDPRRST